ncbi:hypothetical protein SEA_STARCEVICH_31 [Mycobacterium phage Starcevich]|nr:hypothetical protein SEA_STARCEVICH_31 [Mycobacterium phage Starcevich]
MKPLHAITIGTMCGVALSVMLSWAFATGSVALVEKLIDDRPDF